MNCYSEPSAPEYIAQKALSEYYRDSGGDSLSAASILLPFLGRSTPLANAADSHIKYLLLG
jgi:hypothetical protein